MSEQQTNQPEGKPPMCASSHPCLSISSSLQAIVTAMKPSEDNSITKKVGKEVLKEGVDQGKDLIVEYEKDNGQEQMDDAQQQVDDPQQRLDDAKAQAEVWL